MLAACRSTAVPDSPITEISIAREGGCNGYYTPASSEGGHGPELMTGRCAVYTFVLTSDGRAEYHGTENVPLIGRQFGTFYQPIFCRLARLVDEIGFEKLPGVVPIQNGKWIVIAMDGPGPTTVSIVRNGKRKTVRHTNADFEPAWLTVLEQEIDRVADGITWKR